MAKGARAKAKVHKKPAEKVNKKPAANVHKKPAKKDAPKAKPKAKQDFQQDPPEEWLYEFVHGYGCSECSLPMEGFHTRGHEWEPCSKCGKVICYNCIESHRLWFTGRCRACTHCGRESEDEPYGEDES